VSGTKFLIRTGAESILCTTYYYPCLTTRHHLQNAHTVIAGLRSGWCRDTDWLRAGCAVALPPGAACSASHPLEPSSGVARTTKIHSKCTLMRAWPAKPATQLLVFAALRCALTQRLRSGHRAGTGLLNVVVDSALEWRDQATTAVRVASELCAYRQAATQLRGTVVLGRSGSLSVSPARTW
jgi:hypothetical protein